MDVKLPNLGEGADSGTVVGVLVKAGALVKKGQNIIELETGKAVAPIPSPADGTVVRLAVAEGDKLAVGQLILVLETAGSVAASAPAPAPATAMSRSSTPSPAAPAPARNGARGSATPRPPAAGPATAAPVPPPPPPTGPAPSGLPPVVAEVEGEFVEQILNENPSAGPYVRRVARDLGIDLRVIAGTGRSGQVQIQDLAAYVARLRDAAARPRVLAASVPSASPIAPDSAPAAPAPRPSIDFAQWGPVTRRPITQLRRMIAERMVASATRLPSVTQFDDAEVTALVGLRKRFAAEYEAKGARLTLTSFVLKAVAATLRKHPLLNASLDDATGEVVLKDYVHLGLAVDTEAGLLVPVIRDADRLDLLQLSVAIQEVATRARERKLALADMQGGSFTISNQGGIGGAHFTPIINAPEVAILGVGRTSARPVVRGTEVGIGQLMPLALSYDHRLIDGGAAARFMVDLVTALSAFTEADVQLKA